MELDLQALKFFKNTRNSSWFLPTFTDNIYYTILMKKFSLLLFVTILCYACQTDKKATKTTETLGDTITTKSGLSYIFLKKGNGKKIQPGARVKVYTDLYINDADTALWKTSEDKDSVFSFIHRKTALIRGFSEQFDYLSEGDEIIAIIPDSLAYGETGNGPVPPKATLIYKPLIVKYVSEPKEMITDTLLAITQKKGIKAAIEFYEKATNDETSVKYHTELEELSTLANGLAQNKLFSELEQIVDYFSTKTEDANMKQNFSYNKIMALEAQGKIKEAIEITKRLSEQELNKGFWIKKLDDLKAKL